MTLITDITPTVRQADFAASPFAHPAMLWLLSAVVVCGGWEIAGRYPISPAFPPFSNTMGALLAHDP